MIPVQVKGKNVEIADAVRRQIEEKIGRLDRYLDDITEAQVELTREQTKSQGDRYVAQVTLTARGAILRGEEKASDMRAAVDSVVDVMHRQVERYKSKLYGRSKGQQARKAPLPVLETAPSGEVVPEDYRMVRTKRVPVKPMFEEEAVEQMELLGHDFFLFFNAANEQLNVLYRRQEGGYGLLVPEME